MFCQIRLFFRKDLGQSGELSGLGGRERNVAVHAHSQGVPDLTEGAGKLPSPGIADACAPGSQTPGPEDRKPLVGLDPAETRSHGRQRCKGENRIYSVESLQRDK